MFHFSAQQTGAPGKRRLCSQTIIQALLYREFQIDTWTTRPCYGRRQRRGATAQLGCTSTVNPMLQYVSFPQ